MLGSLQQMAWGSLAVLLCVTIVKGSEPKAGISIPLAKGPHLFLDDFLIEKSTHLTRKVQSPERFRQEPVVTGPIDGNFTNRVTVLRESSTGRFRLWFNAQTSPPRSDVALLGYMESKDGMEWEQPRRILNDPDRRVAPPDPSHKNLPTNMVANVLDEGKDFPDSAKRFKYVWFNRTGLQVAASPDGMSWKQLSTAAVLPHNHDINYLYRDPIRNRYGALLSSLVVGEEVPGLHFKGRRRVIQQSVSADLVMWKAPWNVITPDDRIDEGRTEFYCMAGVLARGNTLVGMVRVLRDDLPADPAGPVRGIGYTSLAWSHDGETWTWDRDHFLDRSPSREGWDHAMAWISCQLVVENEVHLYYGGYARGHKVNRFTERQIGLVKMPRDRYVARIAGQEVGILRTRPLTLTGRTMTLNVAAAKGEVKVQIVDKDDKPIAGFSFADMIPIKTDHVSAPVTWQRSLAELRGQQVQIEFQLQQANLYAFDLEP